LFDIIQTALGITLQNLKQMYVLYDDFGKLTLKNVETMKLDLVIDENVSENFSYKSSIERSANQIKIMKDDAQSGKRVPYVWPDVKSIEKWGILQYVTKLEEKENMKVKADALLKLYNRKFKSLSIKNISGNILVRAGTSVIVDMDLGDI
ncbi:MAG: hydrolase, partial [Fusobacterium sp.]|nr:hydrolase [Fusobacterium sp.]